MNGAGADGRPIWYSRARDKQVALPARLEEQMRDPDHVSGHCAGSDVNGRKRSDVVGTPR